MLPLVAATPLVTAAYAPALVGVSQWRLCPHTTVELQIELLLLRLMVAGTMALGTHRGW